MAGRECRNLDGWGPSRVKFRRIAVVGALLLLVIVLVFVTRYYLHGRFIQETNDASLQADQITIGSKMAGYVRAVAVDDDQPVRKGQLLVAIDPVDFATRLRTTDADVASARAALVAARASGDEAAAQVDVARAELRTSRAALAFAKGEVARYRPLVAAGAEPASMLAQLVLNRDRAEAGLAGAEAALVQAERALATQSARSGQSAAELGAARTRRDAASNDLANTRLVTPVAGRVANRTVRVGQYVQPGSRLMTIVPDDSLYVLANFKETQLGLMRPGQPAKIEVDALPGVAFTGKVVSVTPGTGANFSLIPPQNATGNFTKIVQRVPVRIRIDAGPAARKVLVPGLSLVVRVDTRASRSELDAIASEQERLAR